MNNFLIRTMSLRFSQISFAVFSLFFLVLLSSSQVLADDVLESVGSLLSERHAVTDRADLLAAAGSEDALVEALLQLRLSEVPPVGIKAAALLLEFSSRSDVKNALVEDMKSDARLGLARLYTSRIENISNEEARAAVAREAFSRSERQRAFSRYSKSLLSSNDSVVKRVVESSTAR